MDEKVKTDIIRYFISARDNIPYLKVDLSTIDLPKFYKYIIKEYPYFKCMFGMHNQLCGIKLGGMITENICECEVVCLIYEGKINELDNILYKGKLSTPVALKIINISKHKYEIYPEDEIRKLYDMTQDKFTLIFSSVLLKRKDWIVKKIFCDEDITYDFDTLAYNIEFQNETKVIFNNPINLEHAEYLIVPSGFVDTYRNKIKIFVFSSSSILSRIPLRSCKGLFSQNFL